MADVKKIATRESYGNTLKELAAEGHEDLVVLPSLMVMTRLSLSKLTSPPKA